MEQEVTHEIKQGLVENSEQKEIRKVQNTCM